MIGLIGLACLVTSILVLAQSSGEYAGMDTCAICHEDTLTALRNNPHWALDRLNLPSEAARGCESCHGPGLNHAEDPSEPIFAFRDEEIRDRSQRCKSCHAERGGQHMGESQHERTGVACDSCHASGHGEPVLDHLLKNSETDLCLSCHVEQKFQVQLPFRHRTSDGVIHCSDCHNSHARTTNRAARLIQQETCFKCHTDKQGPFIFEHLSSTITGCTSCHQPHGSTNPRLLLRSDVRFLCLECHTNTPTFHDLSIAAFENCTSCHTAIHGSYLHERLLR